MTEQYEHWTDEYRPGDDIRELREQIAAGEIDFATIEIAS